MASFNNVPQGELIGKIAEKLKKLKEINPPEWSNYVKTGINRERPPADPDWWFVRTAAVLRTLAARGPIGVSKLRTKYGGKQRRGHKPAKFAKSSGNILRKALQQLESAGLAKQVDKKSDCIHKGRLITTKGIRLLNESAKELFSKYPKLSVKAEKAALEEKANEAELKKDKPEEKKQEVKAEDEKTEKEKQDKTAETQKADTSKETKKTAEKNNTEDPKKE
ncbi:MAG: 30S ribosomal protein S19e [Candidatus Woesearchaeota archaeon]